MKRLVVLIVCMMLLFLGCHQAPDSGTDIVLYSGKYPLRFWETERIEDSQYCVIPDLDTAIKFANLVYESIPKGPVAANFDIQSVYFDEQDEVWVVLFCEAIPEAGPVSTGLCYSIALQKKDGKVLGINYG